MQVASFTVMFPQQTLLLLPASSSLI